MNELTTIERQEMQHSSGVVMPVASPEEMHNAMVTYQRMKESVLDPSDFQDAGGGRKFVKKSGWAKLAIAFGVSSSIKEGYPKFFYDGDNGLARAEFVVVATAPNGRYAEGWGSCSRTESRFTGPRGNVSKLEHDLPATAETRARNRAYAALFGHGEVSYEEVQLLGTDDDVTDAEIVAGNSQRDTPAATGVGAAPAAPHQTSIPKASPYTPASANQLATVAKLSRLLGRPEDINEDTTSAEASERITDLSREYNERKGDAAATLDLPFTQAKSNNDGATGGINPGQIRQITAQSQQLGLPVPGDLSTWSFMQAANHIKDLGDHIKSRVTARRKG